MNYFVLGENNQVQKVSLKSETLREKLLHIYRESPLMGDGCFNDIVDKNISSP